MLNAMIIAYFFQILVFGGIKRDGSLLTTQTIYVKTKNEVYRDKPGKVKYLSLFLFLSLFSIAAH